MGRTAGAGSAIFAMLGLAALAGSPPGFAGTAATPAPHADPDSAVTRIHLDEVRLSPDHDASVLPIAHSDDVRLAMLVLSPGASLAWTAPRDEALLVLGSPGRMQLNDVVWAVDDLTAVWVAAGTRVELAAPPQGALGCVQVLTSPEAWQRYDAWPLGDLEAQRTESSDASPLWDVEEPWAPRGAVGAPATVPAGPDSPVVQLDDSLPWRSGEAAMLRVASGPGLEVIAPTAESASIDLSTGAGESLVGSIRANGDLHLDGSSIAIGRGIHGVVLGPRSDAVLQTRGSHSLVFALTGSRVARHFSGWSAPNPLEARLGVVPERLEALRQEVRFAQFRADILPDLQTCPPSPPSGDRAAWSGACTQPFSELGWTPADGGVACSYEVTFDLRPGADRKRGFVAVARCDLDGDGVEAVFEATREQPPRRITAPDVL